ncbi:MAG: xanthine dehydrogenase family protein subunit M [Chloroflexaceae bacterium]|jgi:carbon-monoxide dehydrogenase medium subunit|nr:xanthine dehydrogenase family protein subunit M [Chloroflexaceae bacterium]
MIPSSFEYFAPTTVAEAVSLLQKYGDDAKILAGGHSLLPAMKLRLSNFGALIDINKIHELRGIHVDGNISIGAMTTYHAIESSDALKATCAILPEAVSLVGDIQVRNRGTLGGSLAHADPAADPPAVMLALDAHVHVTGPGGNRTIAIGDFFTDMLTTSLQPGEIITSITLNPLGAGEGAAYSKFPHPASRYAIVGAAAYVKLEGGKVSACRIGITGAGPKAERQASAEAALIGTDGSAEAIAKAAEHAGENMDVLSDIHAGEDYRRAMIKVYTRRALTAAVERAR